MLFHGSFCCKPQCAHITDINGKKLFILKLLFIEIVNAAKEIVGCGIFIMFFQVTMMRYLFHNFDRCVLFPSTIMI